SSLAASRGLGSPQQASTEKVLSGIGSAPERDVGLEGGFELLEPALRQHVKHAPPARFEQLSETGDPEPLCRFSKGRDPSGLSFSKAWDPRPGGVSKPFPPPVTPRYVPVRPLLGPGGVH